MPTPHDEFIDGLAKALLATLAETEEVDLMQPLETASPLRSDRQIQSEPDTEATSK